MEEVTLTIALVAGLLSFLSPCVLPLVPAYVSYMGGRAVHEVATVGGTAKPKRGIRSRLSILIHGLAFVLGFTVVFVTLGIVTTAFVQIAGQSAAIVTDIIARLGGVIIIFFGLHFMGALRTFFAWLRKNPTYFERFPTLLLLVGLTVAGAFWWASQYILTAPFGNVFVRLLLLVAVVGIVGSAVATRAINLMPLYNNRDALGGVHTSFTVAVLGTLLILWAFVDIIVALPIAALFIVVLFVGKAFEQPRTYWQTVITRLETALYSDTRRDIDPTSSSNLSGSFIMGVTFSAGWTPCIGPIYGAILQLGLQGEVTSAVPLLLMYSLGLGIPFLLTAGLLDGAQSILRSLQRYMGKIELITGSLLVFVGVLVSSGQLQTLSQNLTPAQTEFSISIEECGVSVAQGHITFSDFNACMRGDLHPVALNQGVSDEFDAEQTTITYAVRIREADAISVDISRIDDSFPATVTVLNEQGEEIATSDSITRVDERHWRALDAVELPEAGRYTVVATRNDGSTEPFEFRLIVRRTADADPVMDTETAIDNNTSNVEEVSSTDNLASEDEPVVGLDTGNIAPNFETTTLAGEEVSLTDMRGQIVLVNFWGTWCGPCIREMPDLQNVYDTYAEDGFTILALATRGDTAEDVAEFRDRFDLTFPLIVDEGDVISDDYGIISRPSTFILDQDGVIVFRNFGPVVESQIVAVIQDLLDS